jgi:hypothetical protein
VRREIEKRERVRKRERERERERKRERKRERERGREIGFSTALFVSSGMQRECHASRHNLDSQDIESKL